MAIDPEDEREVAKNLWEYRKDLIKAWKVYAWVWRELIGTEARAHTRWMFLWMTIGMIVFSSKALLIGWIVTSVMQADWDALLWNMTVLLIVSVVQRFSEHQTNMHREYVVMINWGEIMNRTSELFLEKSLGQHLQESEVLSVSNLDKGKGRAEEMMIIMLFELGGTVLMLVSGIVFLIWLNWIAGVALIILVVVHGIWSLYNNRLVVEFAYPIDKKIRAFNRHRMDNVWERVERVKTSGKERHETTYMRGWFHDIMMEDRAFWLRYIRSADLRDFVCEIGWYGIMVYGAWLAWSGQLEMGLLFPLAQWSGRSIYLMQQLGRIQHRLDYDMPSVSSMMDALSLDPIVKNAPDAKVLDTTKPVRVEFKAVSHEYPRDPKAKNQNPAKQVLRNVSLTIEPGEKVALIGKSGAGKTTIMRLIQRYMDPVEGGIYVDGVDLRKIDIDSWRKLLGYVPQSAQIFDGTIRDNLIYPLSNGRRASMTDAEILRLMNELQINFKDRLTEGLETKVGRNGIKLSGGEAQRLAVGAAAIKRPQLLIVDEATSSLDAETELKVQHGLERLLAGDQSALIITHRLATVKDICDKFYVLRPSSEMENGDPQVEAMAHSFEELIQVSPTFRVLATLQGLIKKN